MLSTSGDSTYDKPKPRGYGYMSLHLIHDPLVREMGAVLLLAAVIAIGATFVAILILTYKNKVLSSLTIIEKSKYSVLVLVMVTITTSAVLLVANMTNVNSEDSEDSDTDLADLTLTNSSGVQVQVQVGRSGVKLPQKQQGPIPPASAAISPGENKGLQLQDLPGSIKSITLKGNESYWHNIIKYNFTKERDVNYVEAKLRVLEQNKSDNHAGIVWIDTNNNRSKEYFAFLRPDRLAVYTDDTGEIQTPPDISRQNGKWFTLKMAYMNNTINIFLNDKLEMRVPYTNGNITSAYISKVGIRSFNNVAEFEPIEIGIVNITKATATPSESSGNEIPFVPAYISLQVHVCNTILFQLPLC